MIKAARVPLRLHPAIALAIIVLCAVTILYLYWPIAIVLGQAYLVILVLLGFRYWPPMSRLVLRMPLPHRLIFALLIGGMIAGHFTLDSRTYFPFVAWEIFPAVREQDPVTCREFIATTASGKSTRLLVEQLFPSIVQISSLDNSNLYPPATLEHLARVLAKVYNQQHADDPVRRVDLMVMAVKLHPSSAESRLQPSCELLQRYDISLDR